MSTDPTSSSKYAKLPPLLRQAVVAHEAGQMDAALPLYREFVAEHPAHPTALQLLGLLHSQRGEYEQAIDRMRESLREFPEQAEVANNLGNVLTRCGRFDEAIDSYASALRIEPRYTEALRNLGLCFMKTGQCSDAAKCFQRSLEIQPDDATAWMCLGNAYRRLNNIEPAIACHEKALLLRPDYAEAHHNLGVCLRMRQSPRTAIEHYNAARHFGMERAELYSNLGNALVDTADIEGAVDAFRQAVQRNPADVTSHRNLNSLLWQQGRTDEYLASYKEALASQPNAEALRLALAMALNQQEAHEEAEKVLRESGESLHRSGELLSMLAYTLEGQGRWSGALELHAAAVRLPNAEPNHRVSYARALLACHRPEEALPQAQLGAAKMPFNQRALAYLGLCWRLLGDRRDELLNDYQALVGIFDVPVPPQFANPDEFNARLGAVLDTLHVGKRYPVEQTLRGGTQTIGELFQRPEPEIRELVAGLTQCVQQYISRFPANREHPLFARRSEKFEFPASWSIRLQPQGHHTMHVHPMGWISSAYYVQIPQEIRETDERGGGLKLGEPDIDIGERGKARRLIQPAVGRLVLFPSYMWHGTVPFNASEPRLTVAFDVVPVQ